MRKRNSETGKKLSYRIHTRVTKEKYEELSLLLENSRSQHSLSELLRDILNSRPITIRTYDASQDKLLSELAGIRTELQRIGVNINQAVRWLNAEQLPELIISQALDIVTLYQQTDLKVAELFSVMAKISEQWLPE